MSLTAWRRGILLAAALVVVAILLALPMLYRGGSETPDGIRPGAAVPPGPGRVCVTRAGLCPVGAVRIGDPCTCPDSLQGNVVGHVEAVGGPPAVTNPRDWPGSSGVEDWLYGP